MKRSLFLVPFMLGSLVAAADLSPLAFFDFNGNLLTEGTAQTSINLTVDDVTATVTTSYTGGLGSGTSTYTLTDDVLTSLNDNVGYTSGNGFTLSNSQSYLSAGQKNANADLTITLSGLKAGSLYNVSFVTGLDFEGAGAWNIPSTTNAYESCDMNLGTQCIPVRALGTFNVVGLAADDNGCITFTIDDTNGSHTAVINSMAVALQNVPEPATASLSLLALGALALRRRRA